MKSQQPKPGRPPEGRVKVTWYVLPPTVTRIKSRMGKKTNTPGKVIDALIGWEKRRKKERL